MVLHRHKAAPIVYKLTSPEGKAYIGQTLWKTQRWCRHKQGTTGCRLIKNAIAEYGWDRFDKEVLVEGIDEGELDRWERDMIQKHGTREPQGYNVQPGGGPGKKGTGWRIRKNGASSFDATAPRGPRSAETLTKLQATWEAKREARLAGMGEKEAETARLDAAQQRKHREEKKAGVATDGRYGPNMRRRATWAAKRKAMA